MRKGLFFVLLLPSLIGWSQLKGRVSNGVQPIAEATVFFPSINKGGVTNLDGGFIFDTLPKGNYPVVISYVGFLPQKIPYNNLNGLAVSQRGSINIEANYNPMRLPLLGDLDPRAEFSPIWSIQNIKPSYQKDNDWNFFIGVKNLLDWTPAKNNPFLIARSDDPFDRNVQYDASGTIQATSDNPYALSLDPTYIYAPNQGIRFFIGLNYSLSR